eukprot:gene18996-biopygen6953
MLQLGQRFWNFDKRSVPLCSHDLAYTASGPHAYACQRNSSRTTSFSPVHLLQVYIDVFSVLLWECMFPSHSERTQFCRRWLCNYHGMKCHITHSRWAGPARRLRLARARCRFSQEPAS